MGICRAAVSLSGEQPSSLGTVTFPSNTPPTPSSGTESTLRQSRSGRNSTRRRASAERSVGQRRPLRFREAVGKAVGAGLGAAMNSGHTVRISWADGKQSIIALPEKQYMVLSVLLKDRQIATELPQRLAPEAPSAQPGVSDRVAGALSVFTKGKHESSTTEGVRPHDVTEQISKLAALHAQGILTDAEFADKKAELLRRL